MKRKTIPIIFCLLVLLCQGCDQNSNTITTSESVTSSTEITTEADDASQDITTEGSDDAVTTDDNSESDSSSTVTDNSSEDESTLVADTYNTESDDDSSSSSTSDSSEENATISVDYSDCFQNYTGCAVFYDTADSNYFIYNDELASTKASPNSTFDIISTLVGLKTGVISDETSVMGYDGTFYPNSAWNQDVTLEQAFKSNCIWYFQKVNNAIGKDTMKTELTNLSYGNTSLKKWKGSNYNSIDSMNGFWIESSLKISPLQQVDVLRSIFSDESDYEEEQLTLLKDLMYCKTIDDAKVYGKIGTGYNKKGKHSDAWYTGILETSSSTFYFCIYLGVEKDLTISGSDAKNIAFDIINNYYVSSSQQ